MKFSIIIPVYKCSKMLIELHERLEQTLSTIDNNFEIIMVDDACPDNSWEIIKKLNKKDQRVKGIALSRNFGQHHSISAGLSFAKGDWVVVMDCDLQDKPEEITKLYNKAIEGYDIVFARRIKRKDNIFKKQSSKFFYKIYNYFTNNNFDSSVGNFSIVKKKVIISYNKLREQHRPYNLFLNWLGFKKTYVDVEHLERQNGISSYSLSKLFDLGINNIISHSNKPLKILIKTGFVLSFGSFFFVIWLLINFFLYSIPVQGWTSLMISLYLLGGLLLINLGILGIYVGKVFEEIKNRPTYIISETTFQDKRINDIFFK